MRLEISMQGSQGPLRFHPLQFFVNADYFFEFSKDHSQDVWLLDGQHGCNDVLPLRLGAPPPNMVLQVVLLFNNGADLVIEYLTYLSCLPIRCHFLSSQNFRDSLRFRINL